MNAEKLTKNSTQVIKQAQMIANEYGNPEIKHEHLLFALLTLENSLISSLLKNINPTDNTNVMIKKNTVFLRYAL